MIFLSSLQAGPTNYIINGNFDIWQRNALGAALNLSSATAAYNADRFRAQTLGGTAKNTDHLQSTDVPTVAQSGSQSLYSYRFTNNASATYGASDALIIRHTIEGYDFADIHQKTVKISFWVKSSVAGTYGVALANGANDRIYVTTVTISLANTWEYKTLTVTLDTSGSWFFDHRAGIELYICLDAGTDFQTGVAGWQTVASLDFTTSSQTHWAATNGATFFISQVQLAPIGQHSSTYIRAGGTWLGEQNKCYRYYYRPGWDIRSGVESSNTMALAAGIVVAGDRSHYPIDFPTPMRIGVSSAFTSSNLIEFTNGGTFSVTSVGLVDSNRDRAFIHTLGATGRTVGTSIYLFRNSNVAGHIAFSAEY